jgi:hypothetical protein
MLRMLSILTRKYQTRVGTLYGNKISGGCLSLSGKAEEALVRLSTAGLEKDGSERLEKTSPE